MAYTPNNFNIMYATAWEKDGKAWNLNEGGKSSAIYKSIDAGETWDNISKEDSGFPVGVGVGRIGIAVFDENIIYAVLDNQFFRTINSKENDEGLSRDSFKNMSIQEFNKMSDKDLKSFLRSNRFPSKYTIEKIKSESQVRILNATIDGKESERKQIAETLHDSVSTLLSSANLHLQATQSKFNGKTPEEIDKTQKIIVEASQVIRELSHTLVSSVLLKFGLEFAINDMAQKYSNSQIEIETNLGMIGRYHQNFEIKTYNIIQEFLNNILKHSKAEKAFINLKEVKGELILKISDDGIGFDKSKIKNTEGLGLNQIEARVEMMKGDFDVYSSINNGTLISVRLPILKKEPINHV